MFRLSQSWLGSLVGSTVRSSKRRKPLRRPKSANLRFESLEQRVVSDASFDSAIALGSAGSSNAMDVAIDPAGNAITAGLFNGTVDFDPAAAHVGDADIRTSAGINAF